MGGGGGGKILIKKNTRFRFSDFVPIILVYLGLLVYEIYMKDPPYLFNITWTHNNQN